MSNLNGLCTYLNLTVSYNSGDGAAVFNWCSMMHLFMHGNRPRNNVGTNDTSSVSERSSAKSCMSCKSKSGPCTGKGCMWSSTAQCQTGRQNQKFSHVVL